MTETSLNLPTLPATRPSGWFAVAGSLALTASVATELVRGSLGDRVAGHLLFATLQAVGIVALATVVRGMEVPRSLGRRLLLAGLGLQLGFAVMYAGSAAATGEPWGAVFVLFLAGFVVGTVGGVLLGRQLWRQRDRITAVGVLAAAVLGLAAMVVGVDPWHDVALIGGYLSWAVVGAGVMGRRR